MIPAEVFIKYDAHATKSTDLTNLFEKTIKFFSYELEATINISHSISGNHWWIAILPSLALVWSIVATSQSDAINTISMDIFAAAALWWTLTEGFFLLKSLANFVKITNALLTAGVAFPWTILGFGLILIYYCGIFIYLSFQLITSYERDDNYCCNGRWSKIL